MLWLNGLILLLITAGHTELIVALVNRLHSLPIARPKMRRMRLVEDAVMVVFPFLLFWSVGLTGPAILRGGRWSDLSPIWTVYLAFCTVGLVGLAWSIIRWGLRSEPKVLTTHHSRTVDVAANLGSKPVGTGRFRWIASIPGNQSFAVQVAEKHFCLPRLPEEWHELSILHLADSHFYGAVDRPFFEEIARLGEELKPDLIVFTGDLLDDLRYLRWLPETFGRLQAPLGCYYVLGNHDWFAGPDEIRDQFDRCGWQDVGSRVVLREHRGLRLAIGGTERPWMGTHPDFAGKEKNQRGFNDLSHEPESGPFRILLSHTPDHFGWARSHGIDLMFAGHNHGGQIVLPLVGPVFAPSRHGVRYASGAFWADPTLMCVSRGLSGRHPVRFNCCPEMTLVVLESPPSRTPEGRMPDKAKSWAGG